MKNRLRLLLCGLLLPTVANANLLQEIYLLARHADPGFAAAQADYAVAIEARPQLRAQLLPNLSANATVNRLEEETTATNELSFSQPGQVIRGDSVSANLTLTQPLFDWGIFQRVAQIDEQVALAQLGLHGAEQDLIVRVVSSYFDWLAAEDNLRFVISEKAAIGKQLEQARSRFEVGLSAITDVQEAQARYDLATAQEIEAASALRSAREAMGQITGEIDFNPVALRDSFIFTVPEPANPDIWVRRAIDDNLDLRRAELGSTLAKSRMRESYGGHLPSLSLQGNLGYQDATEFPGGTEKETSSVALRLDIPLFAGGATQSVVRQRRGELDRALADLESARRATVRQARDRYDGVVTGVSRIKALKQAVKSTTTALDAVQAGFNVGSRTSVDVLNAQRELYRAQRDLSRARYNYLLSVLTLRQLVGVLTVDDLLQIDRLLVGGQASAAR